MLTITFKKDNSNVLSCRRADGSVTWSRLRPGMEIHDFAHYAVESALNLRNAFFGYIIKGFDISDFEKPRDQRPVPLLPKNLSLESLQTEHIVNVLQTYWPTLDAGAILNTLSEIFTENEMRFPNYLTVEKLQIVAKRLKDLMAEWAALKDGESIELIF